MGESTILDDKGTEDIIQIGTFRFTLEDAARFNVPNGDCLVGIRPEAVQLLAQGDENQRCEIKHAVYMGNHWEVVVRWQGKEILVNLNPEHYDENQQQHYIHLMSKGIFLLNKE